MVVIVVYNTRWLVSVWVSLWLRVLLQSSTRQPAVDMGECFALSSALTVCYRPAVQLYSGSLLHLSLSGLLPRSLSLACCLAPCLCSAASLPVSALLPRSLPLACCLVSCLWHSASSLVRDAGYRRSSFGLDRYLNPVRLGIRQPAVVVGECFALSGAPATTVWWCLAGIGLRSTAFCCWSTVPHLSIVSSFL